MSTNKMLRRLFVYVLGMFILALGVGISVKSDLGVSPVNSIPYVLSLVTGLEQGFLTTVIFCSYILIQIVLLRKNFKIIQLFQVACATLFGYFVTLCNKLLFFPSPETYPLKVCLALVSVILIAGGIFLYLCADLIPQPAEGLCLAIEKVFGWKYSSIKTVFDCTVVCIAVLISFFIKGEVLGVREGTLIAMLAVGKVIGLMSGWWRVKVRTFLGT